MSHDNKVINPSEFPDSVASGMTIEMSIIMIWKASLYSAKTCPQCGHINHTYVVVDDGWTEWGVPSISVIII